MVWLTVLLGYLFGSIPTAYLAGRWRYGKDIRQLGDGNVGANNAFRQLGPVIGITVALIDMAKGAAAVWIAQVAGVPAVGLMGVGVAAVAGHNWPLFLRFRGGRGVSTAIGILYVLLPLPMLIVSGPGLLVLCLRRNTSWAIATVVVLLLPLGWWLAVPWSLLFYGVALFCLSGLTQLIRARRLARSTQQVVKRL